MLENRVYKRDTIDCYQSLHNKCVLLCVYVHFSPSPTVSNTTGPTHPSLLPIPTCPLPPSKLVSWISARSKFSAPRFIYSCLFFICIIPVMPVVLKLSVYRVINSITLQPPFYPPLHLLQWLPPPISSLCLYMCGTVSSSLCMCMCVTVSWGHGRSGTSGGESCSPGGGSFLCTDPYPGLGRDRMTEAPARTGSAWPGWSGSPCDLSQGRRRSILGPRSHPLPSWQRPPAARWCRGPERLRAPCRCSQTSRRWIGPLMRDRKIRQCVFGVNF